MHASLYYKCYSNMQMNLCKCFSTYIHFILLQICRHRSFQYPSVVFLASTGHSLVKIIGKYFLWSSIILSQVYVRFELSEFEMSNPKTKEESGTTVFALSEVPIYKYLHIVRIEPFAYWTCTLSWPEPALLNLDLWLGLIQNMLTG